VSRPVTGRLMDRRAIVTGAAGGQGSAVARRYAAEGAKVVLTDLPETPIERIAAELRDSGAEAEAVPANVSNEDQVKNVVHAAVTAFGGVDILYNNAAVRWETRDGPADCVDRLVWDETFAVNATGPFLFCKHALPHLLRAGSGVILNVASVAAYRGDTECHAYSASKAALIGLTVSIAQRYGSKGLRALVICPGFIDTPMVASFLEDREAHEAIIRATALRRVGQPDDVAAAAVFFASDEASFVTDVLVPVHGGLVK